MSVKSILTAIVLWVAALSAQAALPIQHWQSASGARVYFVENHDLPILDVSVSFPAGSSHDPVPKAGLASLTQSLLMLGAGGLTEDEISGRFADLGAVPGGDFDPDRASLKLRTLSTTRERSAALELFATLLQKPDFPEAVLEREKARAIAALNEAKTQPEAIADRAFTQALFGSHPYALAQRVEPETLQAIGRSDVVEFYRTHYTRRSAVVAIVGDLTRQQAEQIAQQLTAGLSDDPAPAPIPPVPLPPRGTELRIAHPAAQSHILLGFPGIKRHDPDYFPLYVGNYILGGGGFVSRLTEEVREKRGLAYSVYSYFMPLREAGPFQIGLQTKREQTGQALAIVYDTLKTFIRQGPTAQELKAAKDNLVGGFALRLDSNGKVLDYLSVIGFYGLPLTWLDEYVNRVKEVTLAQIKDAFQRRIDPERLVTVVVGDGGQ